MIAKIAKAVLKLIMPDVTEHLLKVFKLDRVVDYMELPNEADKGVKAIKTELEMMKDELRDANKAIEDFKGVMNKVKNKKVFKKLGI